MKESELYEPVKKFLLKSGCSKVYGEVSGFDVLGIYGPANIIVEMKKNLSFKVVDQAMRALDYAHYVYIAIPMRKSNYPYFLQDFLREKRIGVLEVYPDSYVHPVIPARFNRKVKEWEKRNYPNPLRENIKSYSESQVGGVKGGEAITDYSIMVRNIKKYMYFDAHQRWVTVEQILENVETKYSQPKPQVAATLQAHWNEDWCESKVKGRKRYFRYVGEEMSIFEGSDY